jgi:transglutaminase-like putative cysteine protease
MIYDIEHRTTFRYEQNVSVSQHVLHLMPRDTDRQHRLAFDLSCAPQASVASLGQDYFGNWRHHAAFEKSHEKLVIDAKSSVEVIDSNSNASGAAPRWEDVLTAMQDPKFVDIAEFTFDSPYAESSGDVLHYGEPSFPPGRSILEAATELTSRIHRDFEYQGGISDVSTPVTEVLAMRKGVCQDFAHLQIACLRALGLPARYVSGYLLTRAPEGREKLVGADASHAWVSLWCGPAGWIDFDPTNDVLPNFEHITIGWGRDYGDVSPINGFIVGGGEHEIDVAVDVRPSSAQASAY